MSPESWYRFLLPVVPIILQLMIGTGVPAAHAQNELISSLTIEQGLVNNEVTSLCQDKSGFLWIGTRGGLNRYDGYEFKLIRNPPESGNNFTSQYIEEIGRESCRERVCQYV